MLAEIDALARRAARGSGQVLLLRGEAGVGKSAVIRRFLDGSASRMKVVTGWCDPLSAPRPLGPLIDMLPQLPDAQSAALRAVIAAGHSEAIYTRLLEAFSDGHRWACVIEDAHWADGATLDLVRFLARRVTSLPVLLIVSYRDDDIGPEHPLAVVLGDMSNHAVTRIALEPLSAEAVRLLAAGSGVNADRLHGLTGGNPFYVTEVLAAGVDGADGALPRSVTEAVWGRLARLSAAGRRAAEAVAVCGPRADPQFLETMRPGVAAGLGECMRAGVLLAGTGSVRFRHELARRATLEQIPEYEQRETHRMALAALSRPPVDPDDLAPLAFHAEKAGDNQAIVSYGPAAAERAAALGAHSDAADLYALVLRHAGTAPDGQRVRWLERHAMSCYLSGSVDTAAQSWREAALLRHTLGDRLAEGDDLRWLSNSLLTLGHTAAASETAQTSLQVLQPLGASRQLGWALVNLAQLAAYRYREPMATEYASRANDVADLAGEQAVKLSARIYAALVTVLGTDTGWAELESACHEAMGPLGIAELGALSTTIICWAATAHADLDRADRYVAESVAFCREHHLDLFEMLAAGAGTRIDVYRGDWARAATVAEDILTRPNLSPLHRIWPLTSLALVQARRGERSVMPLLDEALAAAEHDDLFRIGAVWAARAEAAWLAGDDGKARAEAQKGMTIAHAHRDPWLGGHLQRWLHLPGSAPTSTTAGPATPYYWEITGDWATAAEMWTRRGSPYDAAIAQLGGDIPAVEAALATFRQLGARAAADRARQRLSALRGRNTCGHRADTRAHPHGLTRREREILELLAVGHSDADIANTLFISQRTVNNHVHAILGKLGVHNRTQAAGFAARTLTET